MPLVGSQPSHTENTRIITSPSQKPGTASPNSAMILPALSQAAVDLDRRDEPGRDADDERDQRRRERQLQRIRQPLEVERR